VAYLERWIWARHEVVVDHYHGHSQARCIDKPGCASFSKAIAFRIISIGRPVLTVLSIEQSRLRRV
jgi:hypothetical protein